MRFLLLPLVCGMLLSVVMPGGAPAQALEDNDTIFRRFAAPPRGPTTRLALLEVPVAIRPQTDSQAEVRENLGLAYTMGFRPRNRAFGAIGVSIARMEWEPTDEKIAVADVKQLDVTQSVNFWLGRVLVLSFGFGVGILDSLVVFEDGSFEHNVVPYLPLQLGVLAPLGDRLFVGLRAVQTPYFGDGHVTGHARLLFGLGWTY